MLFLKYKQFVLLMVFLQSQSVPPIINAARNNGAFSLCLGWGDLQCILTNLLLWQGNYAGGLMGGSDLIFDRIFSSHLCFLTKNNFCTFIKWIVLVPAQCFSPHVSGWAGRAKSADNLQNKVAAKCKNCHGRKVHSWKQGLHSL